MRVARRSLVVPGMLTAIGLLRADNVSAARQTADDTGHPVVGAWAVATNVDNPADPVAWALFGADGTFIRNSPIDGVGIGVWEATGPRTATLTIYISRPGTDGKPEAQVTRATIIVDDIGDRLTSEYTLEVIGVDGVGQGQHGPGLAEGKRIAPEAMGEPVQPLPATTAP